MCLIIRTYVRTYMGKSSVNYDIDSMEYELKFYKCFIAEKYTYFVQVFLRVVPPEDELSKSH